MPLPARRVARVEATRHPEAAQAARREPEHRQPGVGSRRPGGIRRTEVSGGFGAGGLAAGSLSGGAAPPSPVWERGPGLGGGSSQRAPRLGRRAQAGGRGPLRRAGLGLGLGTPAGQRPPWRSRTRAPAPKGARPSGCGGQGSGSHRLPSTCRGSCPAAGSPCVSPELQSCMTGRTQSPHFTE